MVLELFFKALETPIAEWCMANPYKSTLGAIFVFLVLPTWHRMRKEEKRALEMQQEAIDEGRHEPASIRPYVDLSRCMGSASCIIACPEQNVLKVIGGQVDIIQGSHCIGHGACETSCPVGAIELVFGSERRGIDIPSVAPDFQTNVPGIYVAGELGGMGLIANAVEQGVQTVKNLQITPGVGDHDVVIVGAGPAGMGAALQAKKKGLRYLLLEQEEFGGAIRHYPRQKLVMTRPIVFPGYRKIKLHTIRKEALIEILEEVVRETQLVVNDHERVEAVTPIEGGLHRVKSDKREVTAGAVIIAVGRAGTPRRLGVPGEELEKVVYRLIDPELYQHQHILVVGGGDSALEAACALAEQEGNHVTLSYRRDKVSRARAANVANMNRLAEEGRLKLLFNSNVTAIDLDRVTLEQSGERVVVANDFTFVFAGGVLPTAFLQAAGIEIERHFGKRVELLTDETEG